MDLQSGIHGAGEHEEQGARIGETGASVEGGEGALEGEVQSPENPLHNKIPEVAQILRSLNEGESPSIDSALRLELQNAGLIEVLSDEEYRSLGESVEHRAEAEQAAETAKDELGEAQDEAVELEIKTTSTLRRVWLGLIGRSDVVSDDQRALDAAKSKAEALEAKVEELDKNYAHLEEEKERYEEFVEEGGVHVRSIFGEDAIKALETFAEKLPDMEVRELFRRAKALDDVLDTFWGLNESESIDGSDHAAALLSLARMPGQSVETIVKLYDEIYEAEEVEEKDDVPRVVRTILRNKSTAEEVLTLYQDISEQGFVNSQEEIAPLTELALRFGKSAEEMEALYGVMSALNLDGEKVIVPLMSAVLGGKISPDVVRQRYEEIYNEEAIQEEGEAAVLTAASFLHGKSKAELVDAFNAVAAEATQLYEDDLSQYAIMAAEGVATIPELEAFQAAIEGSEFVEDSDHIVPIALSCIRSLQGGDVEAGAGSAEGMRHDLTNATFGVARDASPLFLADGKLDFCMGSYWGA